MRKLKIYSAVSMNGKIARSDGSVDWLDSIKHEEGEDYGYSRFYSSIDATIMGNNTYKEVLGFDVPFPYKGKDNYVFTRDTNLIDDENVQFISDDHIGFIKKLKEKKGKDIWLVGGGQINSLLLNAELVDEICIHIMPIMIPDGLDIFPNHPIEKQYQLRHSKSYSSGVVELVYST